MPRRRRLSLQQIESFRAVMLAGSVNAAARHLGMSQPALTRLLRRTEDMVGFALFDRVKNRLLPTAEARALLNGVEHIGAQLDALDDAIERIGRDGHGIFRLGMSPSVGRELVPAALGRFRLRFPQVPIRCDTINLPDVADYLALGRGECFISIIKIEHPGVVAREIGPAGLVCLLPARHSLCKRRRIKPSALVGQPLILGEPGTAYGDAIRQLLHVGPETLVSAVVRYAETAIGLTAHGLGIAIVDEYTAMAAKSDKIEVRALDVPPPFRLWLHAARTATRSRYVGVLEQELKTLLFPRQGRRISA